MSTTPRRTKTFATFLHEATEADIDATDFEQDLVTAWNAWNVVEKEKGLSVVKSPEQVTKTKANLRMLAIEPNQYQNQFAQSVAAQIAWQLRYMERATSDNRNLPAFRDRGSEGRKSSEILTAHYRTSGVSSVTSKTDITLGRLKCSMKNADAAQFGSMQHGELTAVISAVWPAKERETFKTSLQQTFAAALDKTTFYELAKKYMTQKDVVARVVQEVSEDPKKTTLKQLDQKQRKTAESKLESEYQRMFSRRIFLHSRESWLSPTEANAFDAFMEKYIPSFNAVVLDKLEEQLRKTVFRKKVMREILTGELRFAKSAEEKIADHMLLWNKAAGTKLYTIDEYLADHFQHFEFSIRDRGTNRGGALRLAAALKKLRMSGPSILPQQKESVQRRQLEEHLNLMEHTVFSEASVGSWISSAAQSIGSALAVGAESAKKFLQMVWKALKEALLELFDRILDLFDASLGIFCDVFGLEAEGKINIPATPLTALPQAKQIMDLPDGTTPE